MIEGFELLRDDFRSAKEKTIQLIFDRDKERSTRLETFVKDELRNMSIHARNQFIVNLFLFLEPEINVLNEQGKLKP